MFKSEFFSSFLDIRLLALSSAYFGRKDTNLGCLTYLNPVSHYDRIDSHFFPLGSYGFSGTLYFDSPLGPSFLNLTVAHPQTEHVESSMEKWQDLFGLLHILFFSTVLVGGLERIDLSGKLDLRTVSNIERAEKGWLCGCFSLSSGRLVRYCEQTELGS